MDDATLRYPIGPWVRPSRPLDAAERAALVSVLDAAPARFRELARGLTDAQLDQSYRPGGWTIRQLIHHVADSHMNSYVRMKMAVTEETPTVKTYDQERWAELPDARTAPIDMSLALIDGLHRRWTTFLRALTPEQWRRTFQHPELGRVVIEESVAMYAWHCGHHAGHIEIAKQRATGSAGR